MGTPQGSAGHGLARALSKLGICSRAEAWRRIEAGRVRVNGVVCRDPERRIRPGKDRIEVDGTTAEASAKVYLMLNKPRGLVTTAADEQGRKTVFDCLQEVRVPHLVAVGRLDRASEGLLLLTNDTAWAASITAPESRMAKVYHVQVDAVVGPDVLERMRAGVEEGGELLAVQGVSVLRSGGKTSWMEVILEEGRNRHIRRMLQVLGLEVLRLIRIKVGRVELGALAKGAYRKLSAQEVEDLRVRIPSRS